MADPTATTTSRATTTAAARSSGGGGLGLDPTIVEALRVAVQAEVSAALSLAPPGSVAGPSVFPSAALGTPLLPAASSATSGELTAQYGQYRRYERCRA